MSDMQAAAFQTRYRDLGERHVVTYQGGGWYRVRKPSALGDGVRMRKQQVIRQLQLMEGRAAPR